MLCAAPVRAVSPVVDVYPAAVYNLTVADGWPAEFFANGVLVHNCTWTPEADWSPDRLDAMVWTAWHTKLVAVGAVGRGQLGNVASNVISLDERRRGGAMGEVIAGG